MRPKLHVALQKHTMVSIRSFEALNISFLTPKHPQATPGPSQATPPQTATTPQAVLRHPQANSRPPGDHP